MQSSDAFHPFLGRILYLSYGELAVLLVGCILSIGKLIKIITTGSAIEIKSYRGEQ